MQSERSNFAPERPFESTPPDVIGGDLGLREVMEMVSWAAGSRNPVLLLGETGTGKELIYKTLHAASPRCNGPCIRMRCGAGSGSRQEAELFGQADLRNPGEGGFTPGLFDRADGGTLYLDEIGELGLEAQERLLQVLQDGAFVRVGDTERVRVDVRVVASSRRDLVKLVGEGRFREDLWYRLNVLPIRIPPLRFRREDIPGLAEYLIDRNCREMNLRPRPRLDQENLERLQEYDWPGNVRELNNIIERALILSTGDTLNIPSLGGAAQDSRSVPDGGPIRTLDEAMADHIRCALEQTGGKVAGPGGAAGLLGLNPSTLRFRMGKLGLR